MDALVEAPPSADWELVRTGEQIEKRYVHILDGVVLSYPNSEPVEVFINFVGPAEAWRVIPMSERSARELAALILQELNKDRPTFCMDVTLGADGKPVPQTQRTVLSPANGRRPSVQRQLGNT